MTANHCCADHKSDECCQNGRMCGGGKQDRVRLIHFKNCFVETGKYFSVSTVHSVTGDNEDHDGLWSEQRHLRYGDVGLGIVFELCVNRV